MTYVRFIAATITATIAMTAIPQTPAPAVPSLEPVVAAAPVVLAPVASPTETSDPEQATIEGVRIVSSDDAQFEFIASALDKFENAGWPLENLEICTGDEDGCGGNAGVHYTEEGYDVVEICTDTEWTFIHELGHVWSVLYLDATQRDEWVEVRGLESWSEGVKWGERGSEHVADIIAFGLRDTWYTPTSITSNDRDSLIEGFTWPFGIAPLRTNKDGMKVPTIRNAGAVVIAAVSKLPAVTLAEQPASETISEEPVAPVELRQRRWSCAPGRRLVQDGCASLRLRADAPFEMFLQRFEHASESISPTSFRDCQQQIRAVAEPPGTTASRLPSR